MIKRFIFLLFLFIYYPILAQNIDRANTYFYAANTIIQVKNADSIRLNKAINLYTKALVLNPELWQAYRNRARLKFRLKKYKNAIDDLTLALKYASFATNTDLCLLRGQCFYALNQFNKAINDFNLIMPFMGDKSYALMYRAKAYWQLNNKDKACADYQAVRALNPDLMAELAFINCL